jgi:hypothetical protein
VHAFDMYQHAQGESGYCTEGEYFISTSQL